MKNTIPGRLCQGNFPTFQILQIFLKQYPLYIIYPLCISYQSHFLSWLRRCSRMNLCWDDCVVGHVGNIDLSLQCLSIILLMEEILHQLRLVVYRIIYKVQNFFDQQYHFEVSTLQIFLLLNPLSNEMCCQCCDFWKMWNLMWPGRSLAERTLEMMIWVGFNSTKVIFWIVWRFSRVRCWY